MEFDVIIENDDGNFNTEKYDYQGFLVGAIFLVCLSLFWALLSFIAYKNNRIIDEYITILIILCCSLLILGVAFVNVWLDSNKVNKVLGFLPKKERKIVLSDKYLMEVAINISKIKHNKQTKLKVFYEAVKNYIDFTSFELDDYEKFMNNKTTLQNLLKTDYFNRYNKQLAKEYLSKKFPDEETLKIEQKFSHILKEIKLKQSNQLEKIVDAEIIDDKKTQSSNKKKPYR